MTDRVITASANLAPENLRLLPNPRKPRNARGRLIREGQFIVAWFAYHEALDQQPKPGARRDFLIDYRRSVGQEMSDKLSLLEYQDEHTGLLRVRKPSNRRHAYEYGLHPLVPHSERTKWIDLGAALFADDQGLVGRFLARPAIKHGHVMVGGFLVLSVLLNAGPMTLSELKRYLSPVLSADVVRGRVERLVRLNLVGPVGDGFGVLDDWEARLEEYERRERLVWWADRQNVQIGLERARADLEVQGGSALVSLKTRLRGERCSVCFGPGGTVDHFPPKKWGGFDYPGLLWPMCWRCNSRLGSMVRWMDGPRFIPNELSRRDVTGLVVDDELLSLALHFYWEAGRQDDGRFLVRSRQLVEGTFVSLVSELSGSPWVTGRGFRDGEWMDASRTFIEPSIPVGVGRGGFLWVRDWRDRLVVLWPRECVGEVEAESRRVRFSREPDDAARRFAALRRMDDSLRRG